MYALARIKYIWRERIQKIQCSKNTSCRDVVPLLKNEEAYLYWPFSQVKAGAQSTFYLNLAKKLEGDYTPVLGRGKYRQNSCLATKIEHFEQCIQIC